MQQMTTLLFMNSGPMIRYWRDGHGQLQGTFLEVHDLNPELRIRFALTPWQLFKLGLNCIWTAIVFGGRYGSAK